MQETVRDLEEQLEQEEAARQKLHLDKNGQEQKWKKLDEQFAALNVSYQSQKCENHTKTIYLQCFWIHFWFSIFLIMNQKCDPKGHDFGKKLYNCVAYFMTFLYRTLMRSC